MISDIIDAFWMTMEMWIFLGILAVALVAEELVRLYKRKTVDNPTLW